MSSQTGSTRTTIIALIVLAAAAGLVWFYTSSDDTGDKSATLEFWHIMNYSPVQEVIDDAVARFEADNPEVRVIQNRIKNDSFKTKLEMALGASEPPDIFHTWGGGKLKDQSDNGHVLALEDLFSDAAFSSRFAPAALDFAYVDETPMCVPVDLSVVLLYYNKKLMAEVGLQPPTTFDELYAACKAIREKGYIPLALGNKNRWPGCFYYVYGTARAEEGRKAVLAAAKGTANAFSHSAFATAGELIAKLTSPEVNAFNKGFQGVGTADARRLIMSDKAAMTLMGSWFIANVKGEDEAFLDNLGIAAFPFNREKANSNGGAIVGGTNCAFSISSKSEHPELAKELMKYLTDSTFAAKWAKTGRIPALTGASPEDFSPHTYRAFELMQQASYVQMYFDQLFAPKLGEAHKETVQALFSGEMSPAEVQQRMNEVMKEAR